MVAIAVGVGAFLGVIAGGVIGYAIYLKKRANMAKNAFKSIKKQEEQGIHYSINGEKVTFNE